MFLSTLLLSTALGAAPADTDDVKLAKTDEVKRAWVAELGKPAPHFELTDTDGKAWSLAALHGKTVVLEWFNPECPVVVRAHEGGPLETLGSRVNEREDTVWLAINSGAPGKQGHGLEKNAKAREHWQMSYPVLLDKSGATGGAYQATTTPHMFVIDAHGKLVYAGHHDHVATALEDVWAGREVAQPRTKNQGCSVKYAQNAELGLLAPNFELVDIMSGKPVRLSDHRGKPVVLEWFNPGCPFVKKAHEKGGPLATTAAHWAEKDVVWIAVNSGAPGKQGTGADTNKGAAERWGMHHAVVLDEEGKVGRAYGATNTPHMYVLDRHGVLAYVGACDDQAGTNYVDAALEAVVAGKPVAKPRTKAYGCSVKYGS